MVDLYVLSCCLIKKTIKKETSISTSLFSNFLYNNVDKVLHLSR